MKKQTHLLQGSSAKGYLQRSAGVWLLLMGAEVLHGIARTAFLAPKTGDFRARQISVFSGSALIMGMTYLTIRWIGVRRQKTY